MSTNGAVLGAGSSLPTLSSTDPVVTFGIDLRLPPAFRIIRDPNAAHPLPFDVTLKTSLRVRQGTVIHGTITDANGNVLFVAGSKTPSGVTTLLPGTVIGKGNYALGINGGNALTPTALNDWPANTDIFFLVGYTFAQPVALPVGTVLPTGMNVASLTAAGDRKVWAIAPMLTPGTQSWSMRLVGGADLGSADSRALQPASSLAGSGNVVLNDPFTVGLASSSQSPGVSVVRTGTGDLEILAGGDYRQQSPFGVYTAGTAIAETGTAANDPYNPGRGLFDGSTVLGAANSAYETTLGSQYMYYTEHGGDFMLVAQGNIGGNLTLDSTQVGGWLWRQGGAGIDQATAWGINFGSYTTQAGNGGPYLRLSTFSGVGTLGGGNVTLRAGGDIGDTGNGIVIAVGGTGRMMNGSPMQTGGCLLYTSRCV